MVTIYNINKVKKQGGTIKFLVDLRGLSGDDKPTSIENGVVENGSTFIEIDSGDIYMFDFANQEWDKV